jgi:hypothetical protein
MSNSRVNNDTIEGAQAAPLRRQNPLFETLGRARNYAATLGCNIIAL